jgi:hypothetical protein
MGNLGYNVNGYFIDLNSQWYNHMPRNVAVHKIKAPLNKEHSS